MKTKVLSRDVIKYIAMFTMLLNHVATMFLEPGTIGYIVLVDIGYFTAVTMCYFLVEGYRYTRSVKAYRNRILLFAVISQIPFYMAFSELGVGLNMMFTLYICVWIVEAIYKVENPFLREVVVFALILLTAFCDWAFLAGIYTLFFVWAGESVRRKKMAYIFSALLLGVIEYSEVGSGGQALFTGVGAALAVMLSGICILYFYNGKRLEHGKTFSKWFFYVFYPAHLLVLVVIRMLCKI